MAIRVRRGLKADLDPNKLLSGEPASPLDTRELFMAFGPGDVQKMVTYENMQQSMDESLDEIKQEFTADIEQSISDAEAATGYATTQGDYAKAQGDYANAKGQEAQGIIDSAAPILNQNLQASYADKATLTDTAVQFTTADDGMIAITAMGGSGSVDVVACGKNIWPKFSNQVLNGITMTVSEDGTTTLNGTATGTTVLNVLFINPLKAGTYTLSSNNPITNSEVHLRLSTNTSGSLFQNVNMLLSVLNKNQLFTITDGTPLYASVRVGSGQTLTNFVIKPQLELGSVSTTYEPYKSNQITIPDVTTAIYPVYLKSYKGITNVFTLSASQPTFTAVAKSELWSKTHDTKDSTVSFSQASEDAELQSGMTHATLWGLVKLKFANILTALAGKIDKTSITSQASTNDANKVPSSQVTYAQGQSISTLQTSVTNLNNNLLKAYIGSFTTISLTPEGDYTVTLTSYGNGTVKSIIPIGFIPTGHWNSEIVFKGTSITAKTIDIRCVPKVSGAAAQAFILNYLVLYT